MGSGYGMEVVHLSAVELEAFRQQTRVVYGNWAEKIGIDLGPVFS